MTNPASDAAMTEAELILWKAEAEVELTRLREEVARQKIELDFYRGKNKGDPLTFMGRTVKEWCKLVLEHERHNATLAEALEVIERFAHVYDNINAKVGLYSDTIDEMDAFAAWERAKDDPLDAWVEREDLRRAADFKTKHGGQDGKR